MKENISQDYISQSEMLNKFNLDTHEKFYKVLVTKLAKIRNGFMHRQKYKDGIYEKYFEARLKENIDFIYVKNRVYYNINSLDKIKDLIAYYIRNFANNKNNLETTNEEIKRTKIYKSEYKKVN